jgi:hypothetical protein
MLKRRVMRISQILKSMASTVLAHEPTPHAAMAEAQYALWSGDCRWGPYCYWGRTVDDRVPQDRRGPVQKARHLLAVRVYTLDSAQPRSYSPTSLGSRTAAGEIRGLPAVQEISTVVHIQ